MANSNDIKCRLVPPFLTATHIGLVMKNKNVDDEVKLYKRHLESMNDVDKS